MKQWAVFGLLGLVWGSSFLWIKIAVAETGPFTLVSFRILFGLIGLAVVMLATRQSLRMSRRTLLAFAFMGVFNTAVPFVLITWGEPYIASSLAAILNATVPLVTIVLAHFWLHDEKITLPKLAGLLVGFVGVVVLVSRDFQPEVLRNALAGAGLWGQGAVLLAAVSYAVAATFSRRHLRGQPPILQSGIMLLAANAVLWTATPALERPLNLPDTPLAWFAIVWLGCWGRAWPM
jgi:drug/metabolite transporter (DMT)-like permease